MAADPSGESDKTTASAGVEIEAASYELGQFNANTIDPEAEPEPEKLRSRIGLIAVLAGFYVSRLLSF